MNIEDEAGELRFHDLGDPTPEEVARVAAWTSARLEKVLERHGRSLDGADDTPNELTHEQLVLAQCCSASAGDRQLLGDAPGQPTRKLAFPVRELDEPKPSEAVAVVGGVNIHAGPPIDGRDRRRRSRLCRYVARPPIAQDRLKIVADGRVRLEFKRAWKDGTYGVLLDPLDFIARLAALVPPPKFHLLRYHGVFAANAKARAKVVPGPAPEPPEPTQLPLAFDGEATELEFRARNSRHPWAWLLRRVFAAEVLVCQRCGGPMRLVEIANDSDAVARVLADVGLGPRPPPRPRPASPGQLELDFAA